MPVSPRAGDFRKLDMDSPDDVALLRHYYEKSNPFSPLRVEHNFGLLMFYCSAFMKHFVYYSAKNEAVVIAMQNGPVLICFDLFCDVGRACRRWSTNWPMTTFTEAILGFTPSEDRLGEYEKIEGEDILFVYDQKENLFKDRKLMFPLLAHA